MVSRATNWFRARRELITRSVCKQEIESSSENVHYHIPWKRRHRFLSYEGSAYALLWSTWLSVNILVGKSLFVTSVENMLISFTDNVVNGNSYFVSQEYYFTFSQRTCLCFFLQQSITMNYYITTSNNWITVFLLIYGNYFRFCVFVRRYCLGWWFPVLHSFATYTTVTQHCPETLGKKTSRKRYNQYCLGVLYNLIATLKLGSRRVNRRDACSHASLYRSPVPFFGFWLRDIWPRVVHNIITVVPCMFFCMCPLSYFLVVLWCNNGPYTYR